MLLSNSKMSESAKEGQVVSCGKENICREVVTSKMTETGPQALATQNAIGPLFQPRESNMDNMKARKDYLPANERISANSFNCKSFLLKDSGHPFEAYKYFGNRLNQVLKDTQDAKPKSTGREEAHQKVLNEQHLHSAEDLRTAFTKHVAKVKYFWRGTNFNYPYAFLRFYKIGKKKRMINKNQNSDEFNVTNMQPVEEQLNENETKKHELYKKKSVY